MDTIKMQLEKREDVEDHKNYLEQCEKKKQVSIDGLSGKLEEFILNDSGDYSCDYTVDLWGNKTNVYLSYMGESADVSQELMEFARQINAHLKWIDDHRECIGKAILDANMLKTACIWMEGYESTDEDGNTYYELEDGERLSYPLTEQMFLQSLCLESVSVSYSAEFSEEMLMDLFFYTMPDFFAYHRIEVFIMATSKGTYEINVNGLAG